MYHYADAYVALETEGLLLKTEQEFNDNTYLEMRTLQKIELINMFTNDTRKLTFTESCENHSKPYKTELINFWGVILFKVHYVI